MDPRCLRDPQAPRLCSALIIFGGEDKRKRKGGRSEEKARDLGVVTGSPLPDSRRRRSGLSGLHKAEGKAAVLSTRDWGFLPQQRDYHKTAFQPSRGLALLRFQVCI